MNLDMLRVIVALQTVLDLAQQGMLQDHDVIDDALEEEQQYQHQCIKIVTEFVSSLNVSPKGKETDMDNEIQKVLNENATVQHNFYLQLARRIERATTDDARMDLADELRELARALLSVPQERVVSKKAHH